MSARGRRTIAIAVLALLAAGATHAQLLWRRDSPDRGSSAASGNVLQDGRFVFVRLRYGTNLGQFGGFRRDPPWAHDYPRAERNFMKILRDLTYVTPYMDGGNVLGLEEAELFSFPLAYMSEPGFWNPSEDEAAALRAYLQKGGFVIFDDFRGWDLENLQTQMGRVLPGAQWVELDISHPIFHAFFEIETLDFVQPYERADQGKAVFYGVFEDNDPTKRLMVVANHNNDIGEYWEFSDTGFVPINLSNEAYKFGVNYVVYAMTH